MKGNNLLIFEIETVILTWCLILLVILNLLSVYFLYKMYQKLIITQFALLEYKQVVSTELAQIKFQLNKTINTLKVKNYYK